MIRQHLHRIPSLFKGKQKLWWAFVVFLIWILFIDSASLVNHLKLNQQIKKYKQQIFEIQNASEENRLEYNKLKGNPEYLQEYARQKFLLKKHNETIFIIDSLK